MSADTLVTPPQFAARWHVKGSTVRRWILGGFIPAQVNAGGRYTIPLEQAEEAIRTTGTVTFRRPADARYSASKSEASA